MRLWRYYQKKPGLLEAGLLFRVQYKPVHIRLDYRNRIR